MRSGNTRTTIFVMSLIVGTIGFVSSVSGLYSSFGRVGIVVMTAAATLIVLFCLLVLRPVITPNPRGVTMLTAISEAGLADIENRDYGDRSLPPSEFYRRAKREIAISGVTLLQTLQRDWETLFTALQKDMHVYVLLLDPSSTAAIETAEPESLNIRREIEKSLSSMATRGFTTARTFHVRFTAQRLAFSAVMIDGDVSAKESPHDKGAEIRIQPATMYRSIHKGVVFQFAKGRGRRTTGFDYFAEDLRNQWLQAIERPEIIVA
jgi:hypothetical protein